MNEGAARACTGGQRLTAAGGEEGLVRRGFGRVLLCEGNK
mgnify:CR=1 FL=1